MTYNLIRSSISRCAPFAFLALGAIFAADARAVVIPTVPIGNVGNAGEAQASGTFGAVDYEYRIGTTEVTNAQYAEFLNAKAKTDTYFLWSTVMGSTSRGGITRSGGFGNYTYSLKANFADKPVNFMNWYTAARFANWLHNGQGSGDTETGSYTLLGGTAIPSNASSITRNPGATWVLPSTNEWYKAAYYDPTLNGGSGGYWDYPTRSDTVPTMATASSVGVISNPGANVANYGSGADWNSVNGNVTTVGSAGPLSQSYYGTSDQGGNVVEWTDTLSGSHRGFTGGGYSDVSGFLWSGIETVGEPHLASPSIGFRVAFVPEPGTAALAALACAMLCVLRKRFK